MVALPRRAARVLVLDPEGAVLLLHGHDSTLRDGGRWWFTVGGGAHGDESLVETALRELAEETGIEAGPDELLGPVWHRRAEFVFEGEPYDQREWFFVLRVAHRPVLRDDGWVPMERRSILGSRWWCVDDLLATADTVFPGGLGQLLVALLGHLEAGTLPADPEDITAPGARP